VVVFGAKFVYRIRCRLVRRLAVIMLRIPDQGSRRILCTGIPRPERSHVAAARLGEEALGRSAACPRPAVRRPCLGHASGHLNPRPLCGQPARLTRRCRPARMRIPYGRLVTESGQEPAGPYSLQHYRFVCFRDGDGPLDLRS